MRKIISLLLLISISTCALLAQDLKVESNSLQPKTVIKLSFLFPGLIVEQNLTNKFTVQLNLWESFDYKNKEIDGETTSTWYFYTNLTLEPRFYFASNIRFKDFNGNYHFFKSYLGLQGTIGINYSYFSGGYIIGIHEEFDKRGFWNIGVGIGYQNLNRESGFAAIYELGIGILLNKNN